ncbi:MAG: TraB/GumN family protein [Nitrospirota bacterium]
MNSKGEKMRKKTIRFLPILLIFFLFSSSVYAKDAVFRNQKNFLWKVQSKTCTVYVLGSIHFFKKDMYPLNKKIEDAFKKSNILVVEANINDVSQIDVQKLIESAFYPENEGLEKHVSRETYEIIKKGFGELGLPLEFINKQKPWFLALTLTSMELVKLGFDPNYGIEVHFLSKASEKKILELESLDYQINIFSRFSDKDQELFLLYTLKDLNTLSLELDKLIQAWTSGDTKTMESIISKSITEDKRMSSFYEKLIYERNRNMVSRIEEFLKTKETYFIIVGAGHLVGNKGIIEILKRKGYQIEQL